MFHLSRKQIILILIGFFLNSSSLMANTMEFNFWSDRRQKIEAFQNSIPMPSLAQSPRVSPKRSGPQNFRDKLSRAVPSMYGKLTLGKISQNKKSIVLLEDIHQNFEAQKNISHTVDQLLAAGLIDWAGVEGYYQTIDLKQFNLLPREVNAQPVYKYLLETGEISGLIYSFLKDKPEGISILGVDDKTLHQENINAYLKSLKDGPSKKNLLDRVENQLSLKKENSVNPQLNKFDRLMDQYHKGEKDLADIVLALSQYKEELGPHLKRFMEAAELEKIIDFKKVEDDRAKLFRILTPRLNVGEAQALYSAGVDFQMGRMPSVEFYQQLEILCGRYQISLSKFVALEDYIAYGRLVQSINGDQIFEELIQAEDSIYSKLIRTEIEQTLIQSSRSLRLQSGLLAFSLTPHEWQKYEITSGSQHFGLDLSPYEEFYRLAELRDKKMVEAIKLGMANHQSGLAMVGGFHSGAMRQLLEQEGFDVHIIKPVLSQVDNEAGSSYLSVFEKESVPVSALFAGVKLFNAPNPARGLYKIPGALAALSHASHSWLKQVVFEGRSIEIKQSRMPQSNGDTDYSAIISDSERHMTEAHVRQESNGSISNIYTNDSQPLGLGFSYSYLANIFNGQFQKLNWGPRILFSGYIILKELGRLMAGPQLGLRSAYGRDAILTGIFTGKMPWKSVGKKAGAGYVFPVVAVLLSGIFLTIFNTIPIFAGTIIYIFIANLMGLAFDLFMQPFAEDFISDDPILPDNLANNNIAGAINYSPVANSGLRFQLGPHFDPAVVHARLKNNSETVLEKLRTALDNKNQLFITSWHRLFDGGGSALDVKEYGPTLLKGGSNRVVDLLSTITVSSKLPFRLAVTTAKDPETLEYFSRGKKRPKIFRKKEFLYNQRGHLANGYEDAIPYIFFELFQLKGIRIEADKSSSFVEMGGMERSSLFISNLITLGSILSGANLSYGEIYSLSSKIENDVLGGVTGSQGPLSSFRGGIWQHIWLSSRKGYISAVSIPVLDNQKNDMETVAASIEKHFVLVQSGIKYIDGEPEVPRYSAFTNRLWIDLLLLKDRDPYSMKRFESMVILTNRYANALRFGDFKTVSETIIQYVDIRIELTLRWQNMILDAMENKPGRTQQEVRNGKSLLQRLKNHQEDFNHFNLIGKTYDLRTESVYSLGAMGELIKKAKLQGVGVMPVGAGGSLAIAVSPHGIYDLTNFLKSNDIGELTEEKIEKNKKKETLIRGYMHAGVGMEGMVYEGWEAVGFSIPALSQPGIYDQESGQFIDINNNENNMSPGEGVSPLYWIENILPGYLASVFGLSLLVMGDVLPLMPGIILLTMAVLPAVFIHEGTHAFFISSHSKISIEFNRALVGIRAIDNNLTKMDRWSAPILGLSLGQGFIVLGIYLNPLFYSIGLPFLLINLSAVIYGDGGIINNHKGQMDLDSSKAAEKIIFKMLNWARLKGGQTKPSSQDFVDSLSGSDQKILSRLKVKSIEVGEYLKSAEFLKALLVEFQETVQGKSDLEIGQYIQALSDIIQVSPETIGEFLSNEHELDAVIVVPVQDMSQKELGKLDLVLDRAKKGQTVIILAGDEARNALAQKNNTKTSLALIEFHKLTQDIWNGESYLLDNLASSLPKSLSSKLNRVLFVLLETDHFESNGIQNGPNENLRLMVLSVLDNVKVLKINTFNRMKEALLILIQA